MSTIYNVYVPYPFPYWFTIPMHNSSNMYNVYEPYHPPYRINTLVYNPHNRRQFTPFKDYGPEPFVVNIEKATKKNNAFRTTLWTGDNSQLTLMNINVGDDIGLEIHPTVDQFIRIEEGQGFVEIGDSKDMLAFQKEVYDGYAIMIPAGKWHNVTNIGDTPLKLYAIYAPPEHPRGTIHKTKADAEEEY